MSDSVGNLAFTANGALTLNSSGSDLVDLFFLAGASRGKDISNVLTRSYSSEKELTLRLMLWTRDARGGAGERQTFRNMLLWLEKHDRDALKRIITKVPLVGRWDDLLIFESTEMQSIAYDMVKDALVKGDGLAAKWMPRKGAVAHGIREHFGWTPKYYRKRLVELTKVVETNMCAKDWSGINYSHVPSVAAARYRKAFRKHDAARYDKWVSDVMTGANGAKVNAGAVFPHDVLRSFDGNATQIQWDSLPNYCVDGKTILPVVDVSGSMGISTDGNTTAMKVAISVGLYLAERQHSAFKDVLCTFESNPNLFKVSGSIENRYNTVIRKPWGGSTNIDATFQLILDHAKKHNVPQKDMPEYIIILSDMEFDMACSRRTSHGKMKDDFKAAGYELPKIIFWNLAGREGNSPVSFKEDKTALVSGFSPAIVKSVLSVSNVTPLDIVIETLANSRYDVP